MSCKSSAAWCGCALLAALYSARLFAAEAHQAGEVVIESATLTTVDGTDIKYEVGTLYVPENRSDPKSRIIGVGFARVKAPKPTGAPPTFHLPGGPGSMIIDRLESPNGAELYLPYLSVGDVVLVEQRGYTVRGDMLLFNPPQRPPQPLDQPVSFADAVAAQQAAARAAVAAYAKKGIDLSGYTVLELADDVDDLRRALGYQKISLVGQSFGSQWGFAIMRRHPQIVERAMLSGVEPLDNGYDMPSHSYAALQRIAWDIDRDPKLRRHLPKGGLMAVLRDIYERLRKAPVSVQVKNPETNQMDTVVLGVTDFQLFMRGAASQPARVLQVYRGDYSAWARMTRNGRLGGGRDGIVLIAPLIDTSTGATPVRNHQLHTDPAVEFIGPWGFDLDMATADIWPSKDVGDDFRTPVLNRTPVLFVQGDWDTSTPIENALGIQPYFPNSRVLIVHRGPHMARRLIEQTMPEVMQKIYEFLRTGRTEQLPVRVELPYKGFESNEGGES